jgi:hypothetical protein
MNKKKYLIYFLFFLTFACGESDRYNSLERQADVKKANCAVNIQALENLKIQSVKNGMDQLLLRLSNEQLNQLVIGTKIYQNKVELPEQEKAKQFERAISTLNDIGTDMFLLGLTKSAPKITISETLISHEILVYPPLPKDLEDSQLTLQEQYEGFPSFGLSVGASAGDAGLAVIGEIDKNINGIVYSAKLMFSPNKSKYILKTNTFRLSPKFEYNPVPFVLEESCLSDPKMNTFLNAPI